MATITHKVIEQVAHTVPASKLLVGDVVATKGTADSPQRLRRVDIVELGTTVSVIVSTPKTGADVEAIECKPSAKVLVVGRVEELAVRTASPKAKTQRATKSNPAPVKVTVDAVAQTTPETAKPSPRPKQTRQASQVSFADKLAAKLTDKLGAKLDTLVESALDAALDAAIARVLA